MRAHKMRAKTKRVHMTNDERERTRESIVQFAKEAGGYLPPPAPKAQTEAREVLQEMFIDQVSSYYLAGRDLVKPLAESMAESIAVDERGYMAHTSSDRRYSHGTLSARRRL